MEKNLTLPETAGQRKEAFSAETQRELTRALLEKLDTEGLDLKTYSPLTLAFIGDSIFDLLIRTMVVREANTSNHVLHRKASGYVKAESQSVMAEGILPLLNREEHQIYLRGRNAKPATMAKHASVADYRRATGFEALMGSLYLQKRYDRMVELAAAGLYYLQNQGSRDPDGGRKK